jgi:hypothetical protein
MMKSVQVMAQGILLFAALGRSQIPYQRGNYPAKYTQRNIERTEYEV